MRAVEQVRRRWARMSPTCGPEAPDWPALVRKEDCPGCRARRDGDGRLCPGFCGPDCEVRRSRDALIAALDEAESAPRLARPPREGRRR